MKNRTHWSESDTENVVPLDEKFIPESIARVENLTGTPGTGFHSEIFNSYYDHYGYEVYNIASGDYSHAEGAMVTASGRMSHAEGYDTKATARCVHAEGEETEASGECSHVEGEKTIASAQCAHAEGYKTTASKYTSHAEGQSTKASGENSHAEGYITTASGENSHAEGRSTVATGYASHAEGWSTKASSSSQHVQGKCNIEDTENKYAHIVGNGTSDSDRSNAHTLDWEGNAWYAGSVEGDTMIIKSSTEGSTKRFKITVDDTGIITATEIVETTTE